MQTPAQQAKPAQPPKPVPPPEFQAASIDKLSEPELIGILKDGGASAFQKAKACQRLATVGTKDAVPPLAALLPDAQLGHYARYGLETIPDPSADDALRSALGKVRGRLQVGVINSLGERRDAKAAGPLAKLLYGQDPEVAQAAAASLGKISGAEAAKILTSGLSQAKGTLRSAVAGAGLVCAEGLLARGDRGQALALYTTLSGADVPKPVRLAAMRAIIAAETALDRPR